jgi:predicted O-methyltransferase YrrM
VNDDEVSSAGGRDATATLRAGRGGAGRLLAAAKLLRGGGVPWLRAARDGLAAIRLAVGATGLSTGVLECLRDEAADTAAVRARLDLEDDGLLEPWLRVLQAHGFLRATAGRWSLSRRGRRLLDDEMLRAAYEGFAGFHTELYRDLPRQLHGGPPRRDITEHAETIAQITRSMEPVLHEVLVSAVRETHPTRVLDVGCGAGQNLAVMLEAAPVAQGVGIEVDDAVADLAERLFEQRGLAERARVLRGDVAALAAGGKAGGPYDLVLLANVVYYLPPAERVPLFRSLAGLLSETGTLLITTTAATPDPFSRHFDLLLRAQGQGMELPEVEPLRQQLTDAGLRPAPARRLAPGGPLITVTAQR